LLPLLDGTPGVLAGGSELLDRFLTVREVAQELRVCTATVYALCERRELAHVRVSNAIRVPRAALAAYVRRSSTNSTSP